MTRMLSEQVCISTLAMWGWLLVNLAVFLASLLGVSSYYRRSRPIATPPGG